MVAIVKKLETFYMVAIVNHYEPFFHASKVGRSHLLESPCPLMWCESIRASEFFIFHSFP